MVICAKVLWDICILKYEYSTSLLSIRIMFFLACLYTSWVVIPVVKLPKKSNVAAFTALAIFPYDPKLLSIRFIQAVHAARNYLQGRNKGYGLIAGFSSLAYEYEFIHSQ